MTARKPAGHYTFKVFCSFQMQFTFTEKEVQPDPGGRKEDFEPTDAALRVLEQELAEHCGQDYVVENVQVEADSQSLIGFEPSPKG